MIHRTGRPSVPDLSRVYIEDEQRLLEYVDSEWRPVPEERLAEAPSVVDVLRAHEWTPKGCACGWAQGRRMSRRQREAERHNHHHHVASMLTYRSLVWPPTAEYIRDRPR